jgi:hypothetical protein
VLSAIDLDNQPLFVTDKIRGKAEDRLLATKFSVIELCVTESLPKLFLGIGGIAS